MNPFPCSNCIYQNRTLAESPCDYCYYEVTGGYPSYPCFVSIEDAAKNIEEAKAMHQNIFKSDKPFKKGFSTVCLLGREYFKKATVGDRFVHNGQTGLIISIDAMPYESLPNAIIVSNFEADSHDSLFELMCDRYGYEFQCDSTVTILGFIIDA